MVCDHSAPAQKAKHDRFAVWWCWHCGAIAVCDGKPRPEDWELPRDGASSPSRETLAYDVVGLRDELRELCKVARSVPPKILAFGNWLRENGG